MADQEDAELEGFIVSDIHLSASEYNLSQEDEEAKLKEIEMRRATLKNQQD
jgi:hypothetical protein